MCTYDGRGDGTFWMLFNLTSDDYVTEHVHSMYHVKKDVQLAYGAIYNHTGDNPHQWHPLSWVARLDNRHASLFGII